MAHQKQRRAFRRWNCMMPCRCDGVGFRSDGFIMNLSYGGAGIAETRKLPTEGLELLVTIRPRVESIELGSRVAWVKTEGQETGLAEFGLEFAGPWQETQEKLKAFFPRFHVLRP